MQTRIEGVSPEKAGLFTRFVYWLARRKLKSVAGQARVPGPLMVMAHHTPILLAYGGFESGLERVGSTWIYVNRGIGMEGGSAPRVRFSARPEITVIEVN